jgi:GTP-binding protein
MAATLPEASPAELPAGLSVESLAGPIHEPTQESIADSLTRPPTDGRRSTPEPASNRVEAPDEASLQRLALAWLHTARFLTTASRLTELPAPTLAEIAFVGRSNAGKSTAINTLAQHKRLAFASRTPGRTQHINLFDVGPRLAPDARLADLPGYGYAAVDRTAKLRWQAVMADYLRQRESLTGVVLMVDSRHGFTALDRRLLEWIEPRVASGETRLLTLLTKADKLNRRDAERSLAEVGTVLGDIATEASDISVTLFSALSRQGVPDAAMALRAWIDKVATQGADATASALARDATVMTQDPVGPMQVPETAP